MLDLRLSALTGRAVLACDEGSVRVLQVLRGRYVSSSSITNQAFELDVEDLLVNLRELAIWPSDDADIRWQPELRALVEGNVADAAILRGRLSGALMPPSPSLATPQGGWRGDLTDFQRRDLDKLLELRNGANFSVPGAGKTRVTLAFFQTKRDQRAVSRMLVVCPKSAFESWRIEAEICFPEGAVRVAVMTGTVPLAADIILINYERLPEARSALLHYLQQQPTLLVLDEAHRMKLGAAGAWGATCIALGPYAKLRMILTGTPAPNGSKDLENLLAFVWPGQGRADVVHALSGNDLRTASDLLRPLFVRTTKSELRLPPVRMNIRRIVLPPLHREIYNALLGQVSGVWQGGTQDVEALGKVMLYLLMAATTPALLATGSSRHEALPYRIPPIDAPVGSTLRELLRDLPQYELSPKYQEVVAIVGANAKNGRKTLVWSTFVRNLKSLEALLMPFRPAVVHGGSEDREAQLVRFRQDPNCLVLLSNPATLGEGVSLHQVCHDAVYLDRDFAAGRFVQSLDRIHRLGLADDARTEITVLVADETIDELVEQRLARKLQFMGGVLDDPAVLQLADLDEEPAAGAGMDNTDLEGLLAYLSGNASA